MKLYGVTFFKLEINDINGFMFDILEFDFEEGGRSLFSIYHSKSWGFLIEILFIKFYNDSN